MKISLGSGFTFQSFTEHEATGMVGGIVSGPAAPQCKHRGIGAAPEGQCAGGIHFENSELAKKEGRPMWKLHSIEPLTITPSIMCGCGGQHGFITNGRWVKA